MHCKTWQQHEIDYLCERWGTSPIKAISQKLKRSETAIAIKAGRLGLGPFLESGTYVTVNQLRQALGIGGGNYYITSWVKNRNFPIRKKRVRNNAFNIVYLDDFWRWAEKNRSALDFSKFEENSLGKEPDWVKEKRRQDFIIKAKYNTSPWTKHEDERLKTLLKTHRYTYKELSQKLGRKCGAIQSRIHELRLKERPIKEKRNYWTDREHELLDAMLVEGFSYEAMGEKLDRSAKSIRGIVYRKYGTEQLDKAREKAKEER